MFVMNPPPPPSYLYLNKYWSIDSHINKINKPYFFFYITGRHDKPGEDLSSDPHPSRPRPLGGGGRVW